MSPTQAHTGPDNITETLTRLAGLKPINTFAKVNRSWANELPESTRKRFEKYGIDLSGGYPGFLSQEEIPKFIEDAYAIRNEEFPYVEKGLKADPEKKALLSAASEVIHLTKHVGTELVGIQLADLTSQQKDELALLVAERVVVFFRDQDLSPQNQLALGEYWGQIERHPQAPHVPLPPVTGFESLGSGISIIWRKFQKTAYQQNSYKGVGSHWHTDLVHEKQTLGLTHLHLDSIPAIGGDTAWASAYAAYDKLSPALQEFLDGKTAIHKSAHPYLDPENPLKGPVFIEREHPLVRTHPVTGWKSLFVNRSHTLRIVGLEPDESRLILEYLFGIFEKNLDIQVRFKWQPTKNGLGTSAIWDNRVSQHVAIPDFDLEEDRHGTRVTALAEIPYFDPKSKSQRQALGLDA